MAGKLFLEDLAPGRRFETSSYRLEETEIVAFASMYDPQPFHLDRDAASRTFFGELVASGWQTVAVTMRLLVTSGPSFAAGIVGRGAEVTWLKPVRPGDVLRVVCEVVDVQDSRSHPERGTVTVANETINQNGEVVQILKSSLVVPRREPA